MTAGSTAPRSFGPVVFVRGVVLGMSAGENRIMIRKAFKMSVNPDAHAEYERRHRPIWTELEETLRAHGVRVYSIFLDTGTHTLFAYAEIDSEERWAAIAATDVCRRWWKYMRDVMPAEADDRPVSVELREVFRMAGTDHDDRGSGG